MSAIDACNVVTCTPSMRDCSRARLPRFDVDACLARAGAGAAQCAAVRASALLQLHLPLAALQPVLRPPPASRALQLILP